MSVAFTNQLRRWRNCSTAKNIRFVDAVWSNLGRRLVTGTQRRRQFKVEIQPLATTVILTNEHYSGSHERIATVKKISKSSVQMSIYSTEI